MFFGCTLMAPHGGLFVLAIPHAVGNVGMYLLSIIAGTVVTGAMYSVLKPSIVISMDEIETAEGSSAFNQQNSR